MATYFKQTDSAYNQQRPDWLIRSLTARGLPVGENPRALFVMGDAEEDWSVPAAMVFTMPPGYQLFRHAHTCFRFEVIVAGTLLQEDGSVLVPGDVMVAKPHETYGPHVAGKDGCTTVEVFGQLDGLYRLVSEGPDGELCETDVRTGATAPGYVDFPVIVPGRADEDAANELAG